MASKRRIRRKQCLGKVRFTSMNEASHSAYLIRTRGGTKLFPYGCKFCGGYHIGHIGKRVKKAIAGKQ